MISCSAAKHRSPAGNIPAIERYDGVLYKVIKKAMRERLASPLLRVAIISAKYGLIESSTPIACYDQRMDINRAKHIAGQVRTCLKQLLAQYESPQVYISLGRDYARLVAGLPELKLAIWANGPIGVRAAALKKWLIHTGKAAASDAAQPGVKQRG
ncbi:MAG: DUF6884 domain-containing protein [Phycisphaerae bacterium]